MSRHSLPLAAFEEYLLWEDRPAYPFSCFARLRFTGQIDRQALDAALRAIMPRHPLLASRLERQGWRPSWTPQPGAMPQIEWHEGPAGPELPAAGHQDLQQDIGLKVFVTRHEGSSDLTLQFHHACCDGAGIEVFVNDLLIAYAIEKNGPQDGLKLPPLDPGLLARRGAYGLTLGKFLAMLPRQLVGVLGAGQFFGRSPVPMLPHRVSRDGDSPPQGYPATCRRVFTREETRAYHAAAKRLGVTSNDLMIRDGYLALDEWRSRHGTKDDGWMRLMVPMNLRSKSDRLLPAANEVGSVFMDRRSHDFARPAALLAGIARELQIIKEKDLGLIFVYALNVLRLLPGGLRHIANQDKCTVSAIFSNIGRVLRRCPLPRKNGRIVSGNLVLEQIDGAVPVKPYSCVSFFINEYAHCLSVMLHYDPRPLGLEQANDLVSTFARRVQATAASQA